MLRSSIELSEEYSDRLLNWIIEKPEIRLKNYNANFNYLEDSRLLLSKFSRTCSDKVYSTVEEKLYYYFDDAERDNAVRILEGRKAKLSTTNISERCNMYSCQH